MTLLRKVLTASFIMLLAVSAQAAMKMERQQISKLNLSLEIPQTLADAGRNGKNQIPF